MTIPRVIVRDLGDHANKKELVAVFSRFSSFKNVWVANNPPGFAYVFFHDMKEALKAVASTNGRYLCGGRVRVELTPIDEKEDIQRRMSTSRRMQGGGQSSHMMRSPSPGIRRRSSHRSPSSPFSRSNVRYTPPKSPRGSPIVRHKRYHTSPTPPPPPKRRSSKHNDFSQSFDRSPPVRGRIHRRIPHSPSPPSLHNKVPLPRRREREHVDHHYHEDEVADYSRFSKRDHRRSSERERYGNRSSPFDSAHLSRSSGSYERKHRISKDDREKFEQSSHDKLFRQDHYINEGNKDIEVSYYEPPPPDRKGLSMEEEQEEWSLAAGIRIGDGFPYMKKEQSPSPPPPPPSPPPIPRSSKRHDSADHGRHGYSSYSHQSPSPSPPPPPPPRSSSHKKSYKSYDTHSPIQHQQYRHRKDDNHDKGDLRRKIKGAEHRRSSRHSREDRGSTSSSSHHRHGSHRSRSPLRYNGNNSRYTAGSGTSTTQDPQQDEYRVRRSGGYSPPTQDDNIRYHKTTSKTVAASPPKTIDYYEQIEESSDRGFFSEVGYHSRQQSPQVSAAEYGKTLPQEGGGEDIVGEIVPPSTNQHQVFGNSFDSVHNISSDGANSGYEPHDRSIVEHFLQIDEVKGSVDDQHREEGGRGQEVYRHRSSSERKIVISGGHKKRDREVIHRKREREVIVKRSPPSPSQERKPNRSRTRTPPIEKTSPWK